MNDFLDFLNTAELDTLTKVPGVTGSIAENIIAARPFEDVNDCLKVKGMGKALLSRLEVFAEAQANGTESRAMLPPEEEAQPAPIEVSAPAQETVKEETSFWSRLGRAFVVFLRALVRLVMIVLLIVGIGAAFYYGLPYIDRTFIAPIEKNTAQIGALESEIESLQSQLTDLSTRVGAIETSIEAHTASLEKLTEMQASLEAQLKDNNDKTLLELKHEVMTTRALDMLARARLYLAQSNFGFAKADVQSARDLLAALQAETNDKVLAQVISRLDLALGNLPDFPVVASGDLEIAWQILMTGEQTNFASPTPTVIETAIPEVSETFTPTQTAPTTGTPVTP